MKAQIYIEGASDSKERQSRCREGFRKLIEKMGFAENKRMPGLTASGSRGAAFKDFRIAHANAIKGEFCALLIDSEDPVRNPEATWGHLKNRDGWEKPEGATDDQVLLMATCMETWIVADRTTLQKHYSKHLQESALPPLDNLESRHRHEVHDKLEHATRDCSNAYEKGKKSFAILAELNPKELEKLPSFARVVRILKTKL